MTKTKMFYSVAIKLIGKTICFEYYLIISGLSYILIIFQ